MQPHVTDMVIKHLCYKINLKQIIMFHRLYCLYYIYKAIINWQISECTITSYSSDSMIAGVLACCYIYCLIYPAAEEEDLDPFWDAIDFDVNLLPATVFMSSPVIKVLCVRQLII